MDMMDATERDGRNGRRQTQQCAPDATVRAGRDGARRTRRSASLQGGDIGLEGHAPRVVAPYRSRASPSPR